MPARWLVDRCQFAASPLCGTIGNRRNPLDFSTGVQHRIVGAVTVAHFLTLAEVDAAGQFAHEEDIDTLNQVGTQRHMFGQRRVDAHRSQVGEQAEVLPHLQQTLFRTNRGSRVRPLRATDSRQEDGVGLLTQLLCRWLGTGRLWHR